MDQQDWQARSRQLNGQVAAITERDLKLWLFTFVVVIVLATGVLLLGVSSFLWTQTPRSELELIAGLVLLVVIFTGYVLHRRYGYTQARAELIRELIYSEKLQSLSLIDPLTQTFNLSYLDQVLPREVNRANRHGTTITFILVEVAGWVEVVKQRGELVGDQMLMAAAQFLKNIFRGSDILLRYDVACFLVIMPETNESQAGCALKRAFRRLDSWHLESNVPFELDLRTGMAAYSRGADANAVLEQAKKYLRSGQQVVTAEPPSCELAGCAPGVPTNL